MIQRCEPTAYQEFEKLGERTIYLVLSFFEIIPKQKVQFSSKPNLDCEIFVFRILRKVDYAKVLHQLLTTNNIIEDK